MNARGIVKLLLCAVALLAAVAGQTNDGLWGIRGPRRFLDLLLGKFRPCINCLCGRSNRGGARFLGGEFTDTHEFPWLANIHVKSNLLVSGVLINDRYVLTAASQMIGATPPEVKVSLGEYDRCNLDVSSVNVSVDAVISHPEFNYESRAHDLALLRLSRSIQFERRILPVCLPNPDSTYLGQVGTLMGWTESRTEEDTVARSCRPRKLGLPILGKRECLKSGIRSQHYHEDSGCMGVIGSGSIICENDVGTSVMHRSYSGYYDLIGILSDINKCNNMIGTAIYTRIGPYIEWIYQRTKDACYCLKPLEIPEVKTLLYPY